jgi:hypothetical protein
LLLLRWRADMRAPRRKGGGLLICSIVRLVGADNASAASYCQIEPLEPTRRGEGDLWCANSCDALAFHARPHARWVWRLKTLRWLCRTASELVTSGHAFRRPTNEVLSQADIARALREAQKIGAKRVKIGPDGSIDIVLETDEQAAALANGRHDEPLGPIRILDRPKKKVVL